MRAQAYEPSYPLKMDSISITEWTRTTSSATTANAGTPKGLLEPDRSFENFLVHDRKADAMIKIAWFERDAK